MKPPAWMMLAREAAPILALLWISSPANSQTRAPDASIVGMPVEIVSEDYARPAERNNTILPGCQVVFGINGNDCLIQIRARVYRPRVLNGRYPLVMLLHGNHPTCGSGTPRVDTNFMYTTLGVCPPGQTVSDNFAGYAYLAEQLASAGYVVVSIDANRGITQIISPPAVQNDRWLILARGRLVLTHLRLLSQCNQAGGSGLPACDVLKDHLDFSHVGLMGHSRGGEGMRAAYNLYRNDPSNNWRALIPDAIAFRGIFEIAPTDNTCKYIREAFTFLALPEPPVGCTDADRANTFDALGANWNALLPMCDGDVVQLAGEQPYDRMMLEFENPPTQKSTYVVWGTNHNFYNTQWQQNDLGIAGAAVCSGPGNTPLFTGPPGSLLQRLTAVSSFMAFFRANVGAAADPMFNRNFNPLFDLPNTVQGGPYPTTRVYRAYVPSAGLTSSMLFNDFDGPNGMSSYNVPDNNSPGVPQVTHHQLKNHDSIQRVGRLSWAGVGGQNLFYQMNWTQPNAPGRDVSAFRTLDFRIAREDSFLNDTDAANFSIQLVGANGVMTRSVPLNRYTDFRDTGGAQGPGGPRGPVGGKSFPPGAPPGANTAFGTGSHPMLQTVRIPLTEFGNFAFIKRQVRGVRFVFDRNLVGGMASGAVYIANVRFTNTLGSGVTAVAPFAPVSRLPGPGGPIMPVVGASIPGTIVGVSPLMPLPALGGQSGYEIHLQSSVRFPVSDTFFLLMIGTPGSGRAQSSILVRFPDPAGTNIIAFALTISQHAAIATGDPVSVQIGSERWEFGGFPTK
jgi:hypothetical protein